MIASQKRKLDTSTVSETSPKQARKDSATSPEATSPDQSESDRTTSYRLELTKMDKNELEADDSAYKLSVSVANEKSENAKYEEYLQSVVIGGESDSFIWDIGAGFSPITPNTSGFGILPKPRTSLSQTPTGRISITTNSRYGFEEGDIPCRGDTLSETLEHLKDSIKSSKEADKLYEMKLRSLLIETP